MTGIASKVGGWILLGFVLMAVLSAVIPYDVVADVHPDQAYAPPSWAHWLGTDHMGRDIAHRSLLACRLVTYPGLLACATALLLAVPLSAYAGFYGGRFAIALRFLFTVASTLPRLIWVLLIGSLYGRSLEVLAVATAVAYAPTLSEALFLRIETLRNAEYVLASRAYGFSDARILWVHLVWGACRFVVFRHLVALFAYFLVLESTLSYLGGFGIAQPNPSFGNMLAFDWGYHEVHPVAAFTPAVGLWLVVLATGWLQDELDHHA